MNFLLEFIQLICYLDSNYEHKLDNKMNFKNIKAPIRFKGKKKTDNYFEGWYFKQVSWDSKNIISIIPGISKNISESHSFIQIIILNENDSRKILNTHYFKFSIEDFNISDEPFNLMIGNNIFNKEGIKLNLKKSGYKIQGEIKFSGFTDIKRSIASPNAMGCFSYLPFMECNHDIISMNHGVSGEFLINNIILSLNNGKGYIEKDWGASFPKEYIWLQSNNFEDVSASIMFSLAHIPFLGASFQGFICNLTFNGEEHRFATYNNSKVKKVKLLGNSLYIIVSKGKYELIINAEVCDDLGILKAPINGAMNNVIKEVLTGYTHIRLLKDSKTLFEGNGNPCAIEIVK